MRTLIFLAFPLLVSCAALMPQPVAVRTILVEATTELQHVAAADFHLLGRVSVRNEHQRFSGSLRWRHLEREDSILLLSPLGQAVAEIIKHEEGVSLVTSKKEIFHARNVEDLTTDVLGWRLPLRGLQYWIQGRYSPTSAASIDIDRDDRIVAIRQDGWQILFTRFYADDPEGVVRPRIIELQFEGLKIRMVIDDWMEV